MKLVETDSPHGDEEVAEIPRPPRPERRRVYVSLALTLSVLVTTVSAVYLAFPKRDNELLTAAIAAHQEGGALQIERPTSTQLTAWTVGAVGQEVPWPAASGRVELLGVRRMKVLRRPVGVLRYRVGEADVSFFALRAWDAPPRTYRRSSDHVTAVSWRNGPWTLVAVGPTADAPAWREALGVP